MAGRRSEHAAHVFREAGHDEAGEGAVHGQDRADLFRADGEVADAGRGNGGRFDVDQLGIGSRGGLAFRGAGRVHEGQLHAKALGEMLDEKPVDADGANPRADEVIAGTRQREERPGDRGDAAGGHPAVFATLHAREPLFEVAGSGMAGARVVEGVRVAPVERLGQRLRGVIQLEAVRQEDGAADGFRFRVHAFSAMFSILWMPPPSSSAEPASAEVSPATRQ